MDVHNIRQQLKTRPIYELPLQVTFYAHLSSESDEQLNSLSNQVSYYQNLIRKNVAWVYVEGYIDEGLSAAHHQEVGEFLPDGTGCKSSAL